MQSFEIVVNVPAPRERVLAVLFDVERWPEWTPSISSVRRSDSGPFTVGSQAKITQPKLPPALWQVTELDLQRGFVWISRRPGVQIKGEHWVEAATDGAKVTLSIQFSGFLSGLVGRIYRRLSRRYLAMEAEGLRNRSLQA